VTRNKRHVSPIDNMVAETLGLGERITTLERNTHRHGADRPYVVGNLVATTVRTDELTVVTLATIEELTVVTTATVNDLVVTNGGTFGGDVGVTGNVTGTGVADFDEFRGSNGSVSDPSFTFASDEAVGMYLHAGGDIGFATNGIRRMSLKWSGMYLFQKLDMGGNDIINVDDISASGDVEVDGDVITDSGTNNQMLLGTWPVSTGYHGLIGKNGYILMSHNTVNTMYVRAEGGKNLFLGSNNGNAIELDIYNNIIHLSRTYIIDGTAAGPAIAFAYDQQTGPYRNGTHSYAVATGGAESFLCQWDAFRGRGIYNHTTTSTSTVRLSGTAGRIGRVSSSLKYKSDIDRFYSERAFAFIDAANVIRYRSDLPLDSNWGIIGLGAEPTAEIDELFAEWDIGKCVCGLSEQRRLTHLATETAKEHGYDDAGFDDWNEFAWEHPNECLKPQAINESAITYATLMAASDLRKRVAVLEGDAVKRDDQIAALTARLDRMGA
jgi:hypothetical protein